MDALISEASGHPAYRPSAPAGAREGEHSRVWFGGSYQEHWSNDYRLLVSYRDRQTVEAVFCGGRWEPAGGDPEACERLMDPRCPGFTRRYFQAAAAAYHAAQSCLRRGLDLKRLYECFPAAADPIAAAELLRLLMDDCGFKLEDALPTVLRCCRDYRLSREECSLLLPLQPRTSHVAELLQEKAALLPLGVHDARCGEYRSPFGALRCGETLRLRFEVRSGLVESAELLLRGEGLDLELPMRREGRYYAASLPAPEEPGALRYSFRLHTSQGLRFLCPDGSGFQAQTLEKAAEGFRLTVFRKDFDTPAWFRRSVMYQIFPDRFAFSDDDTARRGVEYHRALGQTPELHASLDEPVRWTPRSFETAYSPDDFYGGTLRGIEEKLPYLAALGVNCLYLNPIVEARSNHRYDASDYTRVDPILGTNEDFERLCRAAAEYGVRILLDGVFSHTGADSLYFNRDGHYPGLGACQGKDSPYYRWYDFRSFPKDYRCWWGFKDLPEVDERCPDWQDFVVSGQDSVVRTWLRRGAAGWRLDVADELPDEVLALIRRAVKAEKPDAPIVGEVWEDAVIKESYGSRRRYALGDALDSVMNYPFRQAMLDFIHRRSDAFALRDFLTGQQMNYPRPLYYSLMNLLGSHDVDRLRTAMAAPVNLRGMSRADQLNYPFRDEDRALALVREKLCAALQFAIPGVPSVYYGDEQGMWGTGDPFNRLPFREGEPELHDFYAALAARRRAEPVLQTGEALFSAPSADVLTVLRYADHGRDAFGEPIGEGAWLLAINRSDHTESFETDASCAGCGLVTGQVGPCSALWLRLSPGEAASPA
ncbi:MAG: glycoside hydrolase family 13 protein [Oscillospiraceae bacterium]|nr:glycoside hydrolase family 13 protein [Oscillospiraceae bacterium]